MWLNYIGRRCDWISSDGNNDCIRIVGPFHEINVATEFNIMYIDKFHWLKKDWISWMKMWLNFMWWKCDWISWDENVTGFHGMRMWLNFMGWKYWVKFWMRKVDAFHQMWIQWTKIVSSFSGFDSVAGSTDETEISKICNLRHQDCECFDQSWKRHMCTNDVIIFLAIGSCVRHTHIILETR